MYIRKQRGVEKYNIYYPNKEIHSSHPTRRIAKQQLNKISKTDLTGGFSIFSKKKELPESEKEDAKTYSILLENSYASPQKQLKEINGYKRDNELSGQRFQVYYNPKTNHTYVIHRGTTGSIADWKNNLAYSINLYEHTPRYKFALEQQKKAEEKYGAKNITTIGHSQGALLASKVGVDSNKIISYQKPVNIKDITRSPPKNEIDIRTSNDLVSFLNPVQLTNKGSNLYTIDSKTFNPIREHEITNLKKQVGAGRMEGGFGLSGLAAISNVASSIFKGREKGLNSSALSTLSKYGNQQVISAELYRSPLSSSLVKAFDLFTSSGFSKGIKESPYDSLFHLGIVFTLSNGTKINTDKEHVINISMAKKSYPKGTEFKQVSLNGKKNTLQEVIDNTRKYMGDNKFETYASFNNNCQNYISSILLGNGYGNQADQTFVLQNLQDITKNINNYPAFRKFANTVTGFARVADIVARGGLRKRIC
jgi:hypothetical protein